MEGKGGNPALTRIILATLLAVAGAIGIATLPGGASATGEQPRMTIETANTIVDKLAGMNNQLGHAIRTVDRKGADNIKIRAVAHELFELKRDLFFALDNSSSRTMLWRLLDRVDEQLGFAAGYAAGGDKPGPTEKKVLGALDDARLQLRTLDTILRNSGEARDEVYGELSAIGGKVKKLQREVKRDGVGGTDLSGVAKDIEGDKVSLVRRFFDSPAFYGMTFSAFFSALTCVDARAQEANGIDIASDGERSQQVEQALKRARKCKEALEAAVRQTLDAPLSISPIRARFDEATRSTVYSVEVDSQPSTSLTYQWSLTLQAVDPAVGVDFGCTNRGVFGATSTSFEWHHGNVGDSVSDDGCDHGLQGRYGHQGLISLIVSDDRGWTCTATYKGTNTSTASSVEDGVGTTPDCKRE